MNPVGRNDPCPCGSGKKYKKCCLGKETPLADSSAPLWIEATSSRETPAPFLPFLSPAARAKGAGWGFTLGERASAIHKLMRFAEWREFEEDWHTALAIFAGEGLLEPPSPAVAEAMASEMAQINFTSWLLYDMDLDKGQTFADLFLQRLGHELNRGERAYIEKALAARFGLYEILEVRLDEGFTLRDLTTGETLRVHEKMATRGLLQWDIAAMRLMDYGGGYVCIDAGIIPFQREDKEGLLQEIRRLKKRVKADTEAAFFKRIVPALNHWWLARTVAPPLPKVVTAEGDPVVFTKVRFKVLDASALRHALEENPELRAEGDNEWDWIEPLPDGGVRDLGHLTLENGLLTLETTSKQRGKRGRKLLETLAGRSLKHCATEHEDLEQALAEHMPEEDEAEPETLGISKEEKERFIRGYLDTHYHKWPDMPLPALKGKTPRECAANPRARAKVIELLKYLENSEARQKGGKGKPYDFDWLWKDLGLDRDRDA